MNDYNEIYYDEHVKSYQRHMLISWLESAKSERIRAVKDNISVNSKKVPVPKLSEENLIIPQLSEDEKSELLDKFKDFSIPDISFSNQKVDFDNKNDLNRIIKEKFSNINTDYLIPDTIFISDSINDDLLSFDNNYNGLINNISIPESVDVKAEITINDEKFKSITTSVQISDTLKLNSVIEDKEQLFKNSFDNISLLLNSPDKVSINEVAINEIIESIKSFTVLPSINIPDIYSVSEQDVIQLEDNSQVAAFCNSILTPDTPDLSSVTDEIKDEVSNKFNNIIPDIKIPDNISVINKLPDFDSAMKTPSSSLIPQIIIPEKTTISTSVSTELPIMNTCIKVPESIEIDSGNFNVNIPKVKKFSFKPFDFSDLFDSMSKDRTVSEER